MKFIDIHTHKHSKNKDLDIMSVKNVIFGKENVIDIPFSIGLHPWFLNYNFEDFEKKVNNLKTNPHFMAIGECGLDFQPHYLHTFPLSFQEKIFMKQIFLAYELQKPVIVHCVKCFDKLLMIKNKLKINIPLIIHGYTKHEKLAQQLLKSGFFLSFGSSIFSNKSNRLALLQTPLHQLFLETDDQDIYNIKMIYKETAKIKNISLTHLTDAILQNFIRIFKVKIF